MKTRPHRRQARVAALFALLMAAAPWASSSAAAQSAEAAPGAGEGGEVRLHRVRIEGVRTLPRAEVLSLLGLREGDQVHVEQLAAARDSLASGLAGRAGRPFARVVRYEWRRTAAAGDAVDLTVEVDEGPAAVVDTVLLAGPLAGREEEIRALISTRPGRPFDPERWNRDIARIAEHLERGGYPFARIVTRPLVPSFRGGEVGVEAGLEVIPGIAVRVERIEVAGLTRTDPRVVRRRLRLETGALYDAWRAEAARRRLLRTGWFAEVLGPELFRDHRGRYGLLYRVEEQPTSLAEGALGYAPEVPGGGGGLMGSLDARLANLLGSGREFSLHWRRDSDALGAFSLSYLEPYLLGGPVDLELSLAQEVADTQYVAASWAVGGRAAVGEAWSAAARLAGRSVSPDSLASGPDTTSYTLLGAVVSVERETRDRPLNPSRGGWYRVRGSRQWPVGGEEGLRLGRSGLDFEQAVPLRPGWVAFGGLHLRDVRAENGRAPVAEWPRIGGAKTVRGYAERSLLAPRAGWLNLEVRYLTGGDGRVGLLADLAVLDGPAGTTWKGSYGAGAQVAAGAGLLMVAVALPAGEGFSAAVVHLRVIARF